MTEGDERASKVTHKGGGGGGFDRVRDAGEVDKRSAATQQAWLEIDFLIGVLAT